MIEELQSLSRHFLEVKNSPYRRYFIRNVNFNHRMSLIIGQRGVGKTTTLIQTLLDFVNGDRFDPRILYIQADHFLVGSTSLYEIAEAFQTMGGKWIVFDEIHKYPDWSKELKSIYDTFSKLKIFASGSSALEIHKGSHDLTRRAAIYSMQGMSFREYLELAYQIELPAYEMDNICTNHEKLSDTIIKTINKKDLSIVPEFHHYLKIGYFPYFYELNDEAVYKMTLEQNVHATIESDLAAIYPKLTGNSIQKIKKLLIFIANSVPFTPNWNHMMVATEVGDLRTLKTYFFHLENAGLIKTISRATKKFSQLESPSKIYLENPNQLYAISSENPEIGTVREIFFLNMTSQKHRVQMPKDGDFLVDHTSLFEVGGKNKSFNQIKSYKKSYLACDEIEYGVGAKIPLWLFGFLY
jgi:predicted AAA+ superfamily ATPase